MKTGDEIQVLVGLLQEAVALRRKIAKACLEGNDGAIQSAEQIVNHFGQRLTNVDRDDVFDWGALSF